MRISRYSTISPPFRAQAQSSPRHARPASFLPDLILNRDTDGFSPAVELPAEPDTAAAEKLLAAVADLQRREFEASELHKRVSAAYDEARAFANLKVAYGEIEHLTFLSLRIGRIDPAVVDDLRASVGNARVIVALGEDRTRILAAASKKGRFALDTELKRFGFVPRKSRRTSRACPMKFLPV